jgi:hypothetical protein
MRFFSNDARQSTDDQATVDPAADDKAEHPERVESEPVPIPQQRPPSPWAAAPGTPSGAAADSPAADSGAFGTGTPADATAVADGEPPDDRTEPADPNAALDGPRDQQSDSSEDAAADADADADTDTRNEPAAPGDDLGDSRDELADDELAAREAGDGTRADADRADDDSLPGSSDLPFHEPAEAPTAFGASTVGGAVGASALANPQTDERADDNSSTDRPDDNREGTDAAHRPDDRDQSSAADTDDRTDDPIDATLQDDGTFDDPVVVADSDPSSAGTDRDPAAHAGADSESEHDRVAADEQLSALDGTPDDASSTPAAADSEPAGATGVAPVGVAAGVAAPVAAVGAAAAVHSTGAHTGPEGTDESATGGTATGEAGVATPGAPEGTSATPTEQAGPPAEKLPGTVPAPELGPLFADRDAHSLRDRWRDLQLRFVDDPKAATEEAAGLVDEAVEALAASIRRQKEQLTDAAGADTAHDTERLRVRLRTYRDFLDRLLAL